MKRKTLCYIAAIMALVAGILAAWLTPQIQVPFMKDLIKFLTIVCIIGFIVMLYNANNTY